MGYLQLPVSINPDSDVCQIKVNREGTVTGWVSSSPTRRWDMRDRMFTGDLHLWKKGGRRKIRQREKQACLTKPMPPEKKVPVQILFVRF